MKHFLFSIIFGVVFSLNAQQKESPKLVVGIVVDQMSYEYLYRFYDKFGDDGFKLMMNKGTNCRNMHYNYVPTFTGPGHASIYTGTTPSNHGIVANDWYRRSSGEIENCVADSTVHSIGSSTKNGIYSPFNLKANTITDQLKLTYSTSKVISISIKERGSILPGGHLSDGSYWLDYETGNFITSSFFKEKLPNWLVEFNAMNYPDESLKKTWDTYYPIEQYTASGPDNSPYEYPIGNTTKPVFPYDLTKIIIDRDQFKTEAEYLEAKHLIFTTSPFANTHLVNLAMKAIESEGMGKDNQTDMLCMSFSSTDIVGHYFGPYAVELQDMYIRLDLEIARLIKYLNETVGEDEFTIFLTADHAVVPVPQFMLDHKLPGGYLFTDEPEAELRKTLVYKYGADVMSEIDNNNIYLNRPEISKLGLNLSEVAAFVSDEVKQWDHIKRVYTEDELYIGGSDDEWMDMVRRGHYNVESGDLIYVLQPGYLPKSVDIKEARMGTSHGSQFNYDTQVPMLWYGKNIPSQEIHRSMNITDISATLTQLLYLQSPNALTGKPILEILDKK
ncbi:alkaline phosphatase family protein [Kordia sp. YSTF-M3]|uniref:Alkaline phosphatase family protein n=1 Tax=Kordia aestuariivivens TaxID=2759037 RepID=A0ABR7QDA6_9FLAO|nr:alkaline phosphatase family protein [Kordia aestuariivivens]MBC8756555.1 alkaline phosphatase family protein [Kordia aestuariivivens]